MFENGRLSQRLQDFRKREGFSQSKLADLMNVSFMTVRRWESGEVIPRLDEVKRLAEVLHITFDELVNNSKNDKMELVISWDWEDMKKGEMNMEINKFKLILGEDGQIGINGMGKITSREALEEFLGRVRNELEIAFETQVRRGVIAEPAMQGA